MTVQELIDALKTYPPSAEVWTYQRWPGSFWAESVDFEQPDKDIPEGIVSINGSEGPLIGDVAQG